MCSGRAHWLWSWRVRGKQEVGFWESRESRQRLSLRKQTHGPPMRREVGTWGGQKQVAQEKVGRASAHLPIDSCHSLAAILTKLIWLIEGGGRGGGPGPQKTHLGEEKNQEELRSHPYCCSELKRYYTAVKSARKEVSAKAPASDEPRAALVAQRIKRNLVPSTRTVQHVCVCTRARACVRVHTHTP